MGNYCCKARWNPCPGLDVRSDADSTGPRFQINREPFWRQKFLLGDKAISSPKGLQNPAYHEDADLPSGKTLSSNDWERPTLTVPTEVVAAAIAAATAASAPVPPPRTKRNRRSAPLPVLKPSELITPTIPAIPESHLQKDCSELTTDPEHLKNFLESYKDTTENKNALPEQSKDITKNVPTDEPNDATENNIEPTIQKALESQEIILNRVELPSVDEDSILNCSNTVDLLRTVMQRHDATQSEEPDQKLDFSDDRPIAPPKRKTSEERKGSSVSLPGDDVLAKSVTERSRLSKFKFNKKEKGEFDLSIAGTEEHEREEIKSRITRNMTGNDHDSSSNSDSEHEEVLRRSSASSGTLEPYDTACSGDETKETHDEVDDPHHRFLQSHSPPPTPENTPRRGSVDEFPDASIVTQRSASENADSLTRSMSPNLTHIALSKSAILLTPRQWKTPHSSSVTPEHRDENMPEVQVSMEPSDHQVNSRIALTSFIKGTYSDTLEVPDKLEIPDRPDSAASSNAGSLGELEEDIYKLLSESKDTLCDDEDDDYAPLKSTPVKTEEAEIKPAIADAPTFSSAELVRKQQEMYIRSMREIRNENGKEQ